MFESKKPENRPKEENKVMELTAFCDRVKIILQTVNDNEYQAGVTFLEPPSDNFGKAVIFPYPNMIVGRFAGIEVALIRSKPGIKVTRYVQNAIETFSNVHFVFGVGVCYAFDMKKYKFGDVLVSESICDFQEFKFDENGEIKDRGQIINVTFPLTKIFCFSQDLNFEVSDRGRKSKAWPGTFCSTSILIDNKTDRDRFYNAIGRSRTIGGEMEGGKLEFDRKKEIRGVIVIKGVVDYADGEKEKDWQFTAALAAFHYTELQLLNSDLNDLFSGE